MFYIVTIAVSYFVFVLVSDTLLPFKTSSTSKGRWHLNRKRRYLALWCSFSVLLAAAVVHVFFTPLVHVQALAQTLILAVLVATPFVVVYNIRRIRR